MPPGFAGLPGVGGPIATKEPEKEEATLEKKEEEKSEEKEKEKEKEEKKENDSKESEGNLISWQCFIITIILTH